MTTVKKLQFKDLSTPTATSGSFINFAYPPPPPPIPSPPVSGLFFKPLAHEEAAMPKKPKNTANKLAVCAKCGKVAGNDSCCRIFSCFVVKNTAQCQDTKLVKGVCAEFGVSATL
jgi:hypothetical protein